MKVRTLFLLIAIMVIAAFVALNWNVFMAPTALSWGGGVIEAPLGLVMLGLLIFLTALFLVFIVYIQSTVLFDTRRHARELQANRELADKAEASRFTELRNLLEEELRKKEHSDTEATAAILAKIEELDRDLRSAIEESGNSLAAYFAELDDRLQSDKGA